MPEIIRKTLADRLLQSPDIKAFIEQMRVATGLRAAFERADQPDTRGFSSWFLQQAGVAGHEQGEVKHLLARVKNRRVPLGSGREVVGYFRTGDVLVEEADDAFIVELLSMLPQDQRSGMEREIRRRLALIPVIEAGRLAAMVHLLEFGARHFARDYGSHLLLTREELPEPVAEACRYMRKHFREQVHLAEVARQVGLSRDHFCKLFHRTTGLRFTEYLSRVRVEEAKLLLQSNTGPIAPIAKEVGFRSLSQFNRSFRQLAGCSPRQWRNGKRRA